MPFIDSKTGKIKKDYTISVWSNCRTYRQESERIAWEVY